MAIRSQKSSSRPAIRGELDYDWSIHDHETSILTSDWMTLIKLSSQELPGGHQVLPDNHRGLRVLFIFIIFMNKIFLKILKRYFVRVDFRDYFHIEPPTEGGNCDYDYLEVTSI